ncbi:ATP-binding cassette, subfamily B, MsbA [Catalinimonas alkaloidigena]|uniref:ATP-binding cassette, subfamily B, MsbA n=1 Tax=Catalinimonas alkaloidigena TaxID=1075417 RepID=A0A1G9ARJ3_9BACT|nr:ABC transporter ATP-binding protein [Catalinimonas alkaloidigena]SDK29969.1 ATP-binding cassette, subfamily B, MsbA [Catalinimonas alkaloidigena]
MKRSTYFRLLAYTRPLGRFLVPYTIFAMLSIVFGLINFSLIIPLLNVLFGTAPVQAVARPEFSLNATYVFDLFNYYYVDTLQAYGPYRALQFICIVVVVSVLLTNLFRYLSIRIEEHLSAHAIRQLRQGLFDKATSLHLGYFTNERKGDLLARLTTDVQEVEHTVTKSLTVAIREPITIVGYFVVLILLSAKLTLITMLVIPIAGFAISSVIRKLRRDARAGQDSLSRIVSLIDETLGGMRIVKGFNAQKLVRNKFEEENGRYADIIKRMAFKRELASPFSEFTGVTLVAGILLYGGSLVLSSQSSLSPSEFVTYLVIFSQVMRPAKSLSTTFSNLQRGLAAGDRVLDIIDTPAQIQDRPDAVVLPRFENEIELRDVTFAYEETPVLKGISFRIPKGKLVALVGPSGGGKSTIADLIPRFYDPASGSVRMDGRDLRDYTTASVRAQLGIVTQESILFNDTIFNNIAFGKPDATEAEVIEAAKIANAHDFILQTPQGYQTAIGDRGTKLSGGQRQRLSIARAVLKNPPILILDEATSALDNESEKLVQEALFNLMKSRTSLVIAHRLSTIQHADEIIVIEEGRIRERGTHAELREREGGLYRKLAELAG